IDNKCFRFNFYGCRLGCDSRAGEDICEFRVAGYRHNPATSAEEMAMSQTIHVKTCSGTSGCILSPQSVTGFDNITSVVVTVRVTGEARTWGGDDFQLGWLDNSCAAATCRHNTPIVKPRREGSRSHGKWARAGAKGAGGSKVSARGRGGIG